MTDKVTDPVCGMEISEEAAFATQDFEGRSYYFCSPSCLDRFEKAPRAYAETDKA